MPGVYANAVGIAQESLVILEDSLAAVGAFYRDYEPEFTSGINLGDTIRIRRPPTFVTNEFDGVTPVTRQTIQESSVNLVIEKFFDTTVELDSKELSLDVRDFTEQVAAPAMKSIANKVEDYVISKYVGINQFFGSTAEKFNTLPNIAKISAYMAMAKIPLANRMGMVDPFLASDLRSTGDLVRADSLGDGGRAMQDAYLGRKAGIDWLESEALPLHIAGTISNGSLKTGKVTALTAVNATSFALNDTTLTGTVKVGDLFTIAGINGVRGTPITFRVTANATAAGNSITVAFFPALPSAVAANTVVTFVGDHPVSILGDRRGLAYACVAPEPPLGGSFPSATVNYRGLGIRLVFGYDMSLKKNIVSFDTMVGAAVIQPELLFRGVCSPTV